MRRPETGPMQFGNDWPGVFIRGDDAGWMHHMLTELVEAQSDAERKAIADLLKLNGAHKKFFCRAQDLDKIRGSIQMMKPIEDCWTT